VQILGRFFVEHLHVFVALAEEREEDVRDEGIDMRAEVLPGCGGLDAV
jgi:hypothetical protein